MRVERTRDNVYTVTATSQELSALVAGARMALEMLRRSPEEAAPREAVRRLEAVIADYQRAADRLAEGG